MAPLAPHIDPRTGAGIRGFIGPVQCTCTDEQRANADRSCCHCQVRWDEGPGKDRR